MVVGLLIGVGVAASIGTGVMGVMAQQKAQAMQEKINAAQTARQRMQQFREARIARGQIANLAAVTGTSGASSPEAGMGSVTSQMSGNLSFIDQMQSMQNQYASLTGRANRITAIGGMVSSAMMGAASIVGSFPSSKSSSTGSGGASLAGDPFSLFSSYRSQNYGLDLSVSPYLTRSSSIFGA